MDFFISDFSYLYENIAKGFSRVNSKVQTLILTDLRLIHKLRSFFDTSVTHILSQLVFADSELKCLNVNHN